MRAFLLLGALVVSPFLAAPAMAAAPADQISAYGDATRQAFVDALSAARRGDLASRADEARQLEGYPLYSYLIAAQLRHELSANPGPALDTRIARFIAANPDLVPAQQLQDDWLADLADRGRWTTLISATRDSGDDTTTACLRTRARIGLGYAPLAEARRLYDVGSSQPSACNSVFDWLTQTGNLTADLIRDRAHKAILAGDNGLARYLAGEIQSRDAPVIDAWLSAVTQPSSLPTASPSLDDAVAVKAFKRFALSAPEAAAAALPGLVSRFDLNAADTYQMQRYIALLFAEEHRPEALLWYARVDHARMAADKDEHALGWQIRAAIHARRWPLVLDYIHTLPAGIAGDEEWRYWQARALAETGHKPQAQAIYRELAGHRSYHGYLAADAIGADYQFNEHPVPEDRAALARLQAEAGFARVRELEALSMNGYAYREWQNLTDDLPRDELMQAARQAYLWGDNARAILTLVDADYWDDLDIRYPRVFVDDVRRAAGNNDLDPAYVDAIIRTESLFQPTVRSPVGARGLMQLMPGTASRVARRIDWPAPSASDLNNPATNVTLGSRYLADMLANWSGNIALATASYNAGPNKVAQWLPATTMPADIWIATIPYTETREYVQRVMSHMTVFQYRLSEHASRLDERIDPVRPAYAH